MTAGDLRSQPWPSDVLLGADGRLAVTLPFPFEGDETYLSGLAQALSELDGFGTVTSVFFPVSAPVVVDPGAAAQILDLDGGDPPRSFPLFYRASAHQLVAMAPPGTVLRERHHYGCVVASGVHDASGAPLRPSAAMADALRAGGPVASYALLAQQLTSMPQAATAFTTRSTSDWVAKPLSDLAAMPPVAQPTRSFHPGAELDALFGGPVTTTRPGRPPSGGVIHDHVGLVVEGTFASPNYLAAAPATFGLFDAGPRVKSVENIPFMLILPMGAATSVPVAIYQHGLDGDRSTMLQVADDYAARGYAILGIDALWHGSRQPGAVDLVNNLTGQPGPDGIGDPSGAPLANFFDFAGDPSQGIGPLDTRVVRDNFRQATVDLMQVVRLAEHGDWSQVEGVSGVSLDGSQLVYTGASFGSILGANVMAVDPAVRAAVLAVPGAGLYIDLVGNSARFGPLMQSLLTGTLDQGIVVGQPALSPLRAQMSLALAQTLLEPGDGLALAGQATPDKSVLFLEAFNDEVVPNHATESLAAAWGLTQVMVSGSPPTRVVPLPQVPAPYQGAPLRALVQLAPACHSMFTTQTDVRAFQDGGPPFVKRTVPLVVDNPLERAHALALGFLDSFRQGAPAVVDGPSSQ